MTTLYQQEAMSAVRQRLFIVASIDANGAHSMAREPAFHTSHASALSEANRLSQLTHGKAYVVLQYKSGVLTGSVVEF
jgi:hypothetical protein